MTISALPEKASNQDEINTRIGSVFFKLDFERHSLDSNKPKSSSIETQMEGDIPANVPQMSYPSQEEKPMVYTDSNIIQKPDEVAPIKSASTLNNRNNPSIDLPSNSQPPTIINGSTSISKQQPSLVQTTRTPSSVQYNRPPPQDPLAFQHSGIQSSQIQYSPSIQRNGIRPPTSQMVVNGTVLYNNNTNISRQPTAYYSDGRPDLPQSQQLYQYRQDVPPPPQSMMSPLTSFRPAPPPPNTQFYASSQGPYNRPSTPQSYMAPSTIDSSYLEDSSLYSASFAGKKPKKSQFPPATKENLTMYRHEAESGDPKAQLDLAKFLLEAVNQICIDDNPKRARQARENMTAEAQKIVKKLAAHTLMNKHGYPDAQFFLANSYGTGSMGLQTDPDKAFALYVQGSKQNHAACTFRAAVCYEVGAGTKRDKNHALQFYRKAANLGDSVAMYKLGMILLKGFLGQAKNPREGISWLKRAAQQADEDHPHALHELGLVFEKEGIPSVIPDVNYARELFTQAAHYGYAPSQVKLGLAYENGFYNCPVDPRRSIAWYTKAAEQGDVEAEFALSGWYLTGAEGVLPQSDVEAYLWARKAADKGSAKAEYAVGYYTETGTGTRQSLEDAKRWYMRAGAQNYKKAMQRLSELKYGEPRLQQRRQHTRDRNNNTSSNAKDSDCSIM